VAIREEKENKTHTNKIKKMVIYIIWILMIALTQIKVIIEKWEEYNIFVYIYN
jgi:hypothetical protein